MSNQLSLWNIVKQREGCNDDDTIDL